MAIKLKATQRKDLSGSAKKQSRKDGFVPAVVYGKAKESKTVSVESMELLKTVRDEGRNAIISLDIENDVAVEVMLHEYQMDPVKGDLIHVDFYIVDMAEEMDVEVALHLVGEALGSKNGGILQQPLYELQVRAKPGDIPEEVTVDISALEIGDSISVGDLPVSEKYEYLDEAETTVAVVLPPQEEEEETDDVDPSAEPELVGGKDADEEDK